MSKKEIINKIKANEEKIREITIKRNETMNKILKLYEIERRNKE